MFDIPLGFSLKERAFGNARSLQKMINDTEDLNSVRNYMAFLIESIISYEPVLDEVPEHNDEVSRQNRDSGEGSA